MEDWHLLYVIPSLSCRSFLGSFWCIQNILQATALNTLNTFDIELPHKQSRATSDWQSHLLYFSAQHLSSPGLFAQPPPLHTVRPWLHSQTLRECCGEVCRQWWGSTFYGNSRRLHFRARFLSVFWQDSNRQHIHSDLKHCKLAWFVHGPEQEGSPAGV